MSTVRPRTQHGHTRFGFIAALFVAAVPSTVYPAVGIVAPSAGSASVSGTSDASSLVGTHTWVVTSDEASGATLIISAPAFAHTVKPANKSMIQLDLTKLSGAAWAVGTVSDTSTASVDAQVTASSASAGDASFQVDTTFVPGDISVLPGGNYTTTITGTITAVP